MDAYSHVLKRYTPDKGLRMDIPLVIHPNPQSGTIVIQCAGFGADVDGCNDRYKIIAELMQKKIGAVVRSGNQLYSQHGFKYSESIQDDLEAIIDYVLQKSGSFCRTRNPTLYLMGFSAGASVIAVIAHKYPAVRKILLISPSFDSGEELVKENLAKFDGGVYILSAKKDAVVGSHVAGEIAAAAKKATVHKFCIPDCDHHFFGRENGMILSNAPIWAFVGGIEFPTTEGGVVLE